jgi:hypothetical protein
VSGRVQITTDALRTYLNVIEDAFGSEIDYAQLHKVYRAPLENETRYSPAKCIGCDICAVIHDCRMLTIPSLFTSALESNPG